MTGIVRKIYLSFFVLILLGTFFYLFRNGYSYYVTSMEERFFHPGHENLKPSGIYGHGLGIIGTFFMLSGVILYISRKRIKAFSRWGRLKNWLEFHIFLCTLGPMLILFHTSFKFGGIVAISFWSMTAVFLSGIIGRFIYIQIPRTIEGRELSLAEVRALKTDFEQILINSYQLDEETTSRVLDQIHLIENKKRTFGSFIAQHIHDRKSLRTIKALLIKSKPGSGEIRRILGLIKEDRSLSRKLGRLASMQQLFRYWHVAHLPFAVIMIIILFIHVGVSITFGYKWIF